MIILEKLNEVTVNVRIRGNRDLLGSMIIFIM